MSKNSIKKNYIYNLVYQILVLVLPLITTPYVSRVLGASNIGIYSYTYSIATYFILFGSLGIAMYGQREIAYVRDNVEKKSRTFWEIILLRLITMSISLLIYYFLFVNGTEYQLYYRILIIEIVGNILDISWFFQGLEEFKKTVLRNTLVKIASVACIFIFVKNANDLPIYVLIMVLSVFLGNITLWFYLPKYLIKVKNINIKKHLKPTLALFIPQIAMQVYTVLDKTMIGIITGDMTEVGNYEQSQKIVKISMTVVTSLGTVVSPRIANVISNGKVEEVKKYLANSFKFVWFLGIPIVFGLIAVSSDLVPWFLGDGYEKSKMLIMIGSLLVLAIGLNNVTGVQYLIPAKKQNIYTKSVIIGAIFNFVLNMCLIPYFKANGAIVASVLAEFTILIVQIYYVRNTIDNKMIFNNAFKYLIGGIIMFIATLLEGIFMPSLIITTIVQVITGIIIYGIFLLIIKDEYVYIILNKLKETIGGNK